MMYGQCNVTDSLGPIYFALTLHSHYRLLTKEQSHHDGRVISRHIISNRPWCRNVL